MYLCTVERSDRGLNTGLGDAQSDSSSFWFSYMPVKPALAIIGLIFAVGVGYMFGRRD
jgi:membrane-associated PAP2 superfamily phosphatase